MAKKEGFLWEVIKQSPKTLGFGLKKFNASVKCLNLILGVREDCKKKKKRLLGDRLENQRKEAGRVSQILLRQSRWW